MTITLYLTLSLTSPDLPIEPGFAPADSLIPSPTYISFYVLRPLVVVIMWHRIYDAHTHKGWALRVMPFYSNSPACILDIQFSRTFYEGPFPIRAAGDWEIWYADWVWFIALSSLLSHFHIMNVTRAARREWERKSSSSQRCKSNRFTSLKNGPIRIYEDGWLTQKIALFKSRSILKGAIYMCH